MLPSPLERILREQPLFSSILRNEPTAGPLALGDGCVVVVDRPLLPFLSRYTWRVDPGGTQHPRCTLWLKERYVSRHLSLPKAVVGLFLILESCSEEEREQLLVSGIPNTSLYQVARGIPAPSVVLPGDYRISRIRYAKPLRSGLTQDIEPIASRATHRAMSFLAEQLALSGGKRLLSDENVLALRGGGTIRTSDEPDPALLTPEEMEKELFGSLPPTPSTPSPDVPNPEPSGTPEQLPGWDEMSDDVKESILRFNKRVAGIKPVSAMDLLDAVYNRPDPSPTEPPPPEPPPAEK